MSTKARIQKVRAEVEAHEERGWLKGYEEGLAVREQQIVEAQAALEVRNETVREMLEVVKKRNETIRELSNQKKGPKTAREALALAWELAHPYKEGQVVPEGTACLARFDDGYQSYETPGELITTDPLIRTLDPLPDPEPDWLDAPAVLAWSRWDDVRREKIWSKDDECHKSTDGETIDWQDLRDVTPLYPREQEA